MKFMEDIFHHHPTLFKVIYLEVWNYNKKTSCHLSAVSCHAFPNLTLQHLKTLSTVRNNLLASIHHNNCRYLNSVLNGWQSRI